MEYLHNDIIKEYLTNTRYAEIIKRDGLNYLVPAWEKAIFDMRDERWMISEYLNDLTTRRIIDEILSLLPSDVVDLIQLQLAKIDADFKNITIEINEFVGSAKLFDRLKNSNLNLWYYFRITPELFKYENALSFKYSGIYRYTQRDKN